MIAFDELFDELGLVTGFAAFPTVGSVFALLVIWNGADAALGFDVVHDCS